MIDSVKNLRIISCLWLLCAATLALTDASEIAVATGVIISVAAFLTSIIINTIWKATIKHMKHNHNLMKIIMDLIDERIKNNADDA